jgi:hypothetical protein
MVTSNFLASTTLRRSLTSAWPLRRHHGGVGGKVGAIGQNLAGSAWKARVFSAVPCSSIHSILLLLPPLTAGSQVSAYHRVTTWRLTNPADGCPPHDLLPARSILVTMEVKGVCPYCYFRPHPRGTVGPHDNCVPPRGHEHASSTVRGVSLNDSEGSASSCYWRSIEYRNEDSRPW